MHTVPTTIKTPHSTTLFPYTTLFRSTFPLRSDGGIAALIRGWVNEPRAKPKIFVEVEPARSPPCTKILDRKSTRLNSSHSQISYAVLCLKKKNTRFSETESDQFVN